VQVVLSSSALGISASVTVTERTRRVFVGLEPGKMTVRATTIDHGHVFDAAEVVLTRHEPVQSVTLSVPYSR
jgi:hypothetical protein